MQCGGTGHAPNVAQARQSCSASGVIAGDEQIRCRIEKMAELVAFGGKILGGMRICWNIGAHAHYDFNPRGAHGMDLVRIICHQFERANSKDPKYFHRKRIIAQVHGMPKSKIGFDCVEPPILQLIGAEFFHQADAAALLMLVNKHSSALLRDGAKGKMKLLIAVAPHRVKDLSGGALRMNADKRRGSVDVSKGQGQHSLRAVSCCMLVEIGAFKRQKLEFCPAGWEDHICNFVQRNRGLAPFMPFFIAGRRSLIRR